MTKERYRFGISCKSQFDIYNDVYIYAATAEEAWEKFIADKGKARYTFVTIKKLTKNLWHPYDGCNNQ